jgi:hypothetical protein
MATQAPGVDTVDLSAVFKPLHLSNGDDSSKSHKRDGFDFNHQIVRENGLSFQYGLSIDTKHIMNEAFEITLRN